MEAAATSASAPVSSAPPKAPWAISFGPGLVFVLTVVGPADLVSNTTVGATFGCALIWVLALTVVCRFVWLNTSAKYVMVTGESLLGGFGRLGTGLVWVVLVALILVRHFSNLYKVVLIGSTVNFLAPLPTSFSSTIWSLLFTLLGFGMAFWGGYPLLERYFKVLIAMMGGGLVLAAVLSGPKPAEILQGALIPTLPGSQGLYSSILLLTALMGTGAGSLTNVTYSYYLHQKGWRDVSFLQRQRSDLILSACSIFAMGTLTQVAAAGTLRPLGISPEGAEHLVQVFSQTLGRPGKLIFGFGLWAAAFGGYVATTTGYALIATDICRTFIPRFRRPANGGSAKNNLKRDPIYRWFVVFWCFSPLYVLLTPAKPVWLVLAVNSLMVLLIPILALALLRLANDRRRMGPYKNGWLSNAVLVLLVVFSCLLIYRGGLEWWPKLVKLLQP